MTRNEVCSNEKFKKCTHGSVRRYRCWFADANALHTICKQTQKSSYQRLRRLGLFKFQMKRSPLFSNNSIIIFRKQTKGMTYRFPMIDKSSCNQDIRKMFENASKPIEAIIAQNSFNEVATKVSLITMAIFIILACIKYYLCKN